MLILPGRDTFRRQRYCYKWIEDTLFLPDSVVCQSKLVLGIACEKASLYFCTAQRIDVRILFQGRLGPEEISSNLPRSSLGTPALTSLTSATERPQDTNVLTHPPLTNGVLFRVRAMFLNNAFPGVFPLQRRRNHPLG